MQLSELEQGFTIGAWRIEPKLNRIASIDNPMQPEANTEQIVTPKVMALCLLLAQKQGQPVSQDEIAQQVWPGLAISDSSIYQAIAQLRKALGDTGSEKYYIERISGKGYRLLHEVKLLTNGQQPQTANSIGSSTIHSTIHPTYSAIDARSPDSSTAIESQKANISASSKDVDLNNSAVAMVARGKFKITSLLIVSVVVIALLVILFQWYKPRVNKEGVGHTRSYGSVAIMPTQNLTQPKQLKLDSFSQLLLSDLLSLSQIDLILVRDPRHEVQADIALSHSIMSVENDLVLSAQLIDTDSQQVFWSQEFRQSNSALLALKKQFSDQVILQLVSQTSEDNQLSATLPQQDYESFVLAGYLWNKREPASLDQAKALYQEILKDNPDDIESMVGLCNTFLFLHIYSDWSKSQANEACQPLMDNATRLSPENGKVLATQAFLLTDSHPEQAHKLLQRAVQQSPNYASAYLWLGNVLRNQGQVENALAIHQKALALDPLSPIINRSLAYSYLNLRQVDKARQYYQRALSIDASYSLRPVEELDFLPLNAQRARRFVQWSETNATNLAMRPPYLLTQALVRLGLGEVKKAQELVAQAETGEVNEAFRLYTKAALESAKGNMPQALRYLEKRYKTGLQDNTRYLMPYLALLSYTGEYEAALSLFQRYFTDIHLNAPITTKNSGQFMFLHGLLVATKDSQYTARLGAKIAEYYGSLAQPTLSLSYIQWLLYNGQKQRVITAIEILFSQHWLPDYNENILAEVAIKNAWAEAGGEEQTLTEMLQVNRRLLK